MKKLGVVIPVYNNESFLKTCLDSVLFQTYDNLEVVLVDDGSMDQSACICEQYAKTDSRVRVIHQKNQGADRARYNGFNCLDCDFVTFVDADDWLDKECYAKLSPYMEENIDLITYQMIFYSGAAEHREKYYSIPFGRYEGNRINELISSKIIWDMSSNDSGICPSLCNKIVRRSVAEKAFAKSRGLQVHLGEDAGVVFTIIRDINSLVISEHGYYYYRQRPKGKIEPYVLQDEYFLEQVQLYQYLKDIYREYTGVEQQLDYFFVNNAKYRLKKYGANLVQRRWMVPFALFEKNERIILYGAGEVGKAYYEQILCQGYGRLVGWYDKMVKAYKDYRIQPIAEVTNIPEYDRILIAVMSKDMADDIKKELTAIGFIGEKMIWNSCYVVY